MNLNLKARIGSSFPRLLSIWRIIRISQGRFSFAGWGMFTDNSTSPPWNVQTDGAKSDCAIGFSGANESLKLLIDKKQFNLSQFSHLSVQSTALAPLAWRHYVVYWSALSASKTTSEGLKNMIEIGTCDGLTAYFAMSAVKSSNVECRFYLYDAWEAMKGDHLSENEKTKVGMYDYLDLKTTINNLSEFADITIFNKGYVPSSFSTSENPIDISWLHIDLNAASPTLASLDYFYERILPGGIILFDDYAFQDHVETKEFIDSFFQSRRVNLLQLPTGQAIAFKIS